MTEALRDNIRNTYRAMFSAAPLLTRPRHEFNVRNFNVIEAALDNLINTSNMHLDISISICKYVLHDRPFTVENNKMAFTAAYLYLRSLTTEAIREIAIPSSPEYTDEMIASIVRDWLVK